MLVRVILGSVSFFWIVRVNMKIVLVWIEFFYELIWVLINFSVFVL